MSEVQFSKAMIELVFELKKHVPDPLKSNIKLSNPDLLSLLQNHFGDGPSAVARALIKELFFLADRPLQAASTPGTKRYRGQIIQDDGASSKTTKVRKRMYRGREIIE